MKYLLFSFLCTTAPGVFSQNLQLHYDLRHTIDPRLHAANFPSFSFEYFKEVDTVGTGSFLLKAQADLTGKHHNIGQLFVQVSQTLRFWKPPVYLSFNYSGGLGVAPPSFGYYLANSFGAGVSLPFQWKGAWLNASLLYRYNSFDSPSHDAQFTFYFGKGFLNYKIFAGGSFVCWTENRDQGNEYTRHLSGKKFAFFGDPQVWLRVRGGFSVGSRINVLYHIFDTDRLLVYPTVGTKYQF